MKSHLTIRNLAPIVGVLLFSAAIYIIYRELRSHGWREIRDSIHDLETSKIILGLIVSGVSYLVLAGYDMLGSRYIKHPVPLGRNVLATFIGYAFSNTVGHAIITGGSVRLRLYGSIGMSVGQISLLMAFNVFTYWLGFVLVSGVGLVIHAHHFEELVHVPSWVARLAGVICLGLIAAYIVICGVMHRPLRIKRLELPAPSLAIALGQLVVSTIDIVLAAGVLWVVLPNPEAYDPWVFLTVFAVGQTVGHMSLVPGGLGVFDSITLVYLSKHTPQPEALAAILAYRVIYNLLPLVLAALCLGINEFLSARASMKGFDRAGRFGQLSEAVPSLASAVALVAGGVMLVAAAAPRPPEAWRILPPVDDRTFQAIGGALVGLLCGAVLVSAAGLHQRRRWSWRIAVSCLIGLGVLGVLLGEHLIVSVIVLIAAAAVTLCRADIERGGSPLRFRAWRGWAAAWAMIMVLSALVVVLSHRRRLAPGEVEWTVPETAAPVPALVTAIAVTLAAFVVAWAMRWRRARAIA